jgi:hypothetical protein
MVSYNERIYVSDGLLVNHTQITLTVFGINPR